MPTDTGGETIRERLVRLRASLARVRDTIARAESNGQSNDIGGTAVTEIAYERALRRERDLLAEIGGYEARLLGSPARAGIAVTRTVMESGS